jgi:5-formyltetrahydrofolate cyclo-ligase
VNKPNLRKIYLKRQRLFSEIEHFKSSREIADLFFLQEFLDEVSRLHCFLPIRRNNEIDTYQILERIWREFPQIETFVPRVNVETNEIENLRFTQGMELALSDWQIHEPSHNETIASNEIDLVIVPLLAFDERGYRVGYGRGFYDRFLAQCRPDAQKIGLSYFPPVERIDDVNEFDIKLDSCVTPGKVWRF